MKIRIFHKNEIPNLKSRGNWEIVEYVGKDKVKMQRDDSLDEIKKYKRFLEETDYKALKYAEGEYTDVEYEETKKKRHMARLKIRELEEKINKDKFI